MSKVVDEKVVEMKFDNKDFEQNVQKTMSTLDKFKSKLNLNGATKGLSQIQETADKMSFHSIEDSLGSLEKRFSTFGIVGMTVIQNLTNSALGFAKQLGSFFTSGVIQGGLNRATNLQNARFQLNGLLKDAAKVEAIMDDVNYGVLDTAYSLDAAAGVAAQLAASGMTAGEGMRHALRGISGVAAMTNSTYEDIGRIYAQIAGNGRLMGDQLLQLSSRGMNAAAILGQQLGKSEAQIREMVSKGKIDFQTFANAMDNAFGEHAKEANRTMNGAMSNIRAALAKIGAEFFEPLIAMDGPVVNFLNAVRERINDIKADVLPFIKELEQNVGNAIQNIADKIKNSKRGSYNPFFEGMEDNGTTKKFTKDMETIQKVANQTGMTVEEISANIEKLNTRFLIFNNIKNIGTTISTVFSAIGKAYKEIFPPSADDKLFNIFSTFNKLTTLFRDKVAANAEKVSNIFRGLFSVLHLGLDIIKSVVKGVGNLVSTLTGIPGGILGVLSAFGKWTSSMTEAIRSSNVFGKIITNISSGMATIITSLKSFLVGVGGALGTTISKIAKSLGDAIGSIFTHLGNAIKSGDANRFMDLFNKGLISLVLLKLKKFINYMAKGGTLFDTLKGYLNSIKSIADNISSLLGQVGQTLQVWQTNIKAGTIFKIASAIGILALSLVVLSDIDKDKLTNALSAITMMFIELVAAMKILTGGKIAKTGAKLTTMIGLATSVLILASALKKLSSLGAGEILKGVVAIAAMMTILTRAIKKVSSDSKKMVKGAVGIIALAEAIKILGSAVKDISKLDWEGLAKGLLGTVVLMTALVLFTKFAKSDTKMVKIGTGVVILAAGLKILANVCKTFAELSWENIGKGLVAVGGLLLEIIGFSKLMQKTKKLFSSAIALNIVTLAIKGLVDPIKELGNMDIDSIGRALLALGGSLGIMVAAIAALTYIADKGGFWGGINMNFAAMSIEMLTKLLGSLVEAFKGFASIDWAGIAKGLVSIGASIGILVVATKVLSDKDSLSLIACAASLIILANAVVLLSSVGLIGVATGLLAFAGVFTILGVSMKLLKPLTGTMYKVALGIVSLAGSFAVLGAACAALGLGLSTFIAGLVTAFLGFKVIGWDTILKGLVGIAGAFTIIGVAAHFLAPMTGSILALAGSITLFGLSCAAVGVGVSLIVSALSTMAAVGKDGAESAGVALKALISNILQLIPEAVKQLGLGLIELLKIIANAMPVIGDVVKNTVLMLVDVLVTCAPAIAKGFLELITQGLQMLVQYTPQIANLLFDFLIGVLNVLAIRIPELVAAFVNFLGSFFDAVMEVFGKLNPDSLIKGVAALGILIVCMHLLASLVTAVPMAMLGIVAFGLLVAELAAVITAVGQLSKIPGFNELVTDGGNVLQAIGTAIGQFVGGIIGGIAKGVTSALPGIATNLSQFMTNLKPFIEGVNLIDPSIILKVGALSGAIIALSAAQFISSVSSFLSLFTGNTLGMLGLQLSQFMINAMPFVVLAGNINPGVVQNVSALAGAIMAITGANLVNNMSKFMSIFTGGNSLAGFGVEIAFLGLGMRKFVDNLGSFSDEQVNTVNCACNALKTLANVADTIPNSGGLVAMFAGDNDLGVFAAKLPIVGSGLSLFAKSLGTFSDDEIKTVTCAANAIKLMSEAGAGIPNSGGLAALFAGDNDIAAFGAKLPILGLGLGMFSKSLGTFGEEQVTSIKNATEIIKTLAQVSSDIPNSGGLVTLFTGDNDIGVFGMKLPLLGLGLAGFRSAIGNFDEEQMKVAKNAAEVLKMFITAANEIPNSGGLVTLFTGDNDIAVFGAKLPLVGLCLAGFVNSIGDFTEDKIKVAKIAAEIITTLAKASEGIPKSGGIAQLFTGSNDISAFAWKLPGVGTSISAFVKTVGDLQEGQVTVAKNAAEILTILGSAQVPNSGGLAAIFTGSNDISTFAHKLPGVGTYLNSFISNVGEFGENQVNTAKFAAEVLSIFGSVEIPTTNTGLAWLFNGDNDISTYAGKLPGVGSSLSGFISNIGEFSENQVNTAKFGAEALAAMASVDVPTTNGGFKRLFEGDNDISTFANKFPGIAYCLKMFISNIGEFNKGQIDTVKCAVEALKAMAQLGEINIKDTGANLEEFGARMISFANKISEYLGSMSGIDSEALTKSIDKIKELASIGIDITAEKVESLKNFVDTLGRIGKDGISAFVNSLKDSQIKTDAINAINDLLQAVIDKMEEQKGNVENKAKDIMSVTVKALESNENIISAGNAGKAFVQGFANGINNNLYLARDAGSAVGKKALEAAKQAIDSNSPSKETYKLGTFFDQGLVQGIMALGNKVYNQAYDVGDTAREGLAKAISRISNVIESDIDANPTIRPVLDLDDVKSGMGTINSMFSQPNLAVATNLGAISYGMRTNRQNGNEDVVSAINGLKDNIGRQGDSYNINGITYDDGTEVANAIKTLVRAVKVEGRK